MDDDADAKMILTASLSGNWKRPPVHSCIMWLNTIQCDLRTCNLTLNEAVDLAQNRPVWHCALLVVHARKEEDTAGSRCRMEMWLSQT